ncbi:MAG: N-6 DNA methylase, partial [Pseudonocardiaceae bacterium]
MSTGRALQHVLLAPAAALLRQVAAETDGDPQVTRDVLDAAASQVGGFDLDGYRQALDIEARLDTGLAHAWAGPLLDLVANSGVPQRLALATLAQPEVTDTRRRATGAYYTDFRLAEYLARRTVHIAAASLTPASSVIDTAAGTGVLLVALAEQICGADPGALRDLVAHGLSAVDLDPECHRATVTALASLSADLDAICRMATRIHTADSLVADGGLWCRLSPSGRFDAVIGNPPWERLRVTRHETLLAGGTRRHYGADYESPPQSGPMAGGMAGSSSEVDRVRRYTEDLAHRYTLLGDREIDLCHAFLAHGWSLVAPGGSLGMLLPAGLIRAQGTTLLREHLLTTATEVDLTVFHNRSRFFGIDTRFKFLAVCAQSADCAQPGATLRLRHAGNDQEVREPTPVRIDFSDLVAARRDLTVPEVAGEREWQLFQHMTARGSAPDD